MGQGIRIARRETKLAARSKRCCPPGRSTKTADGERPVKHCRKWFAKLRFPGISTGEVHCGNQFVVCGRIFMIG